MKILEQRRKSIKARLIIDFGMILAGICIVNYFVVSIIYRNTLYKEAGTQAEIIANAAITQAQLKLQDLSEFMDNIMRVGYLQDENASFEERAKELGEYAVPFEDLAIINLEGKALDTRGNEFSLNNDQLLESIKKEEFNTFDVIKYKNIMHFIFMRPIRDANEQIHTLILGAYSVDKFFEEIMRVSSGEACFLVNRYGTGTLGISDQQRNLEIRILNENEDTRYFFEKALVYGNEYHTKIQDKNNNGRFNLHYELIGDSRWLLGIIHNAEEMPAELMNFKNSMIIGMVIAIGIGLVIVYCIANSMANKMKHIANHLGDNIKNEFKDPVPVELLKNEDEIGAIAKQMKYLEEQMGEMLTSIKESINYLNDRVVDQEEVKDDIKN